MFVWAAEIEHATLEGLTELLVVGIGDVAIPGTGWQDLEESIL